MQMSSRKTSIFHTHRPEIFIIKDRLKYLLSLLCRFKGQVDPETVDPDPEQFMGHIQIIKAHGIINDIRAKAALLSRPESPVMRC